MRSKFWFFKVRHRLTDRHLDIWHGSCNQSTLKDVVREGQNNDTFGKMWASFHWFKHYSAPFYKLTGGFMNLYAQLLNKFRARRHLFYLKLQPWTILDIKKVSTYMQESVGLQAGQFCHSPPPSPPTLFISLGVIRYPESQPNYNQTLNRKYVISITKRNLFRPKSRQAEMYPKAGIINIITINSFIIPVNMLISSDKFHTEETHYCSCWSI